MRNSLLGVPLDDLSLEDIIARLESGSRTLQISVNVHKIVLWHDKKRYFVPIVDNKDCVFTTDGRWVLFLAKFYGIHLSNIRFGGIDIIHRVFSLSEKKNLKVYLFGGKQDIILKAKDKIAGLYPKAIISGCMDGYSHGNDEIIKDIKAKKPDIVFIALPSPEKELLANKIFFEAENVMFIAGVGGAFDVLADKYRRAPVFLQQMGLEWLYRCIQKPALLKRYILDFFSLIKIMLSYEYAR
jgi:N-acetylglucosaminyldiphosphoundecaprenol N-acetyl-beta-D-mannosaminyltransferase